MSLDLHFDFVAPAQSNDGCDFDHCLQSLPKNEKCLDKVPRDKILPNILSTIGDTPLVRLNRIPQEYGLECEILVKCEFFNPGGSVKDRIALRMIEDAEKEGKIKPGWTLIEPTSGNTGIGIALAAAVKGYQCIIVMTQKMSSEKENVIRALGAQVVRTPAVCAYNQRDSLFAVAQRLNHKIPNSYVLNQFKNLGNPISHYNDTAEEILSACDDYLDMVVMGAGTGGTITGVGRKVKEKLPDCSVVAIDPIGSYLSPDPTEEGFFEVEGIGYEFVPVVFDRSIVDKWIKVNDKDTFEMARDLISKEGLLCGGSSGSAVFGAIEAAKQLNLGKGKRVVVILPDGVRNYMTKFLSDDWMTKRGYNIPLARVDEASPFHGEEVEKCCLHIPVRDLIQRKKLVAIDEDTSVSVAVVLMKQQGSDQLPIVRTGSNNVLCGVVSIYDVMTKLACKSIKGDTPVGQVVSHKFKRIPLDGTLGELSDTLKDTDVVVVVEGEEGYGSSRVVGIITHIDVVDYLLNVDTMSDHVELHEAVNRGDIWTDLMTFGK